MNNVISIQDFVYEESDRVNASPAQGEQSIAVQLDMKKWAVENGAWASDHYAVIVDKHAEARGWKQTNFTGLEIYG